MAKEKTFKAPKKKFDKAYIKRYWQLYALLFLPLVYLRGDNAVLSPVVPIVIAVEDQRLEIIHRAGESGVCRLSCFELIKECCKFIFLVLRKYREYPFL